MTTTHGTRDLDEFRAALALLREELAPVAEDIPAGARFVAHTDGACLGNPDGKGGWAAVLDGPSDETWQLSGHLSSTTNNRAEALGVLAALEWTPAGASLQIWSDSELTVRILEGRYKARANADIWLEINRVRTAKAPRLEVRWVRGHAGDPGNELADRLSVLAATRGDVAYVERRRTRESTAPAELVGLEPRGDWEKSFVRSIEKQLRAGRALSPKQQAIVDRIRARSASAAD